MNPNNSSPVLLSILRVIGICLLGAASGLLIHPLARTSLPGAVVLLVAGGVFWGSILRWPHSLIAALCVVGILPLVSLAEILRDPASHPRRGEEFATYGVMLLLPVAGVFAGKLLKRALTAPANKSETSAN